MHRVVIALAVLAFGGAAQAAAERRVYELPEGAGPHDVAPAPDGKIWYTAQTAGALGVLEPDSGKVTHVALGPGSKPHGVIAGPDGNAWITDSGQNAIVRYSPGSGDIERWPLPREHGWANLNTAAFDADGVLWFTGQSGVYGSLDPRTGTLEVHAAPGGKGPYGIDATDDGEVWFVSLAGSYLARIDADTGAARPVPHPVEDHGSRRVWADSRGDLWVSEWNTGYLSLYSPDSGEWRRWRLPGNSPRAYAVYVDERDIVWVSDFGANATLSFDPRTEAFESYPGSGPGASVRQILGRTGEVWLPESGLDRLVRIRYGTGD